MASRLRTLSLEDCLKSIGWFEVHKQDKRSNATLDIYLGQEYLIGPYYVSDLHFGDFTVSNRHAKIYSITYDESDTQPLVYVEDLSSNGTYWNGSLIGKGYNAVLLSDGDMLQIVPKLTLIFHARNQTAMTAGQRDDNQAEEMRRFRRRFSVSNRRLGSGIHGEVFMAVNSAIGRQVACKIVSLQSIRDKEKEKWRAMRIARGLRTSTFRQSYITFTQKADEAIARQVREIEILKKISHPNVVRLEKVYTSESTLYIFEELMTGGDLFSYLQYRGGLLDEAGIGVIVRQVLEAISYLHKQGIIHRDLKPENILLTSLSESARVVLTDFGCAMDLPASLQAISKSKRMRSTVGTTGYHAPEVHSGTATAQGGYTKAVDMWSLGCVTTVLLTGNTPFSKTRSDRRSTFVAILEAAAACDLSPIQAMEEWQHGSTRLQNFIERLLVIDEDVRMTAQEALLHPWFTYERHRDAWNDAYHFCIKDWKARRMAPDIVENIGLTRQPVKKEYRAKTAKPKTYKPIEAHYYPYHRQMDRLLSPARNPVTLPTIAETPEEAARSRSLSSGSSSTRTKRPTTRNLEEVARSLQQIVPAVENLRIGGVARPAQTTILLETSNKANIRPQPEASLMSIDTFPVTTPKKPLKRPSSKKQKSPPRPRKRRRADIFDIDDDEENLTSDIAEDEGSSRFFSTSFSPMNHRQSVKLGDLPGSKVKQRYPSLLSEDELSPSGYDGPLISKRDTFLNRAQQSTSSKYPSPKFMPSTASLSRAAVLAEEMEDAARATETSPLPIPTSRGITTSSYDWDEHLLKAEDRLENKGFRSARAVGESLERRRARRVLHGRKDQVSGDLSDSIRTAYE
ncbi:hypothetical protein MMC13_007285 [Lambiella insularis]|nr:hypothetical protein [Lambiella insularis]